MSFSSTVQSSLLAGCRIVFTIIPIQRTGDAANDRHRLSFRPRLSSATASGICWRRDARALGVGLLSGGYGREELERAGAYRVYNDPADLLRHLDEVGVRSAE